MMWWMKWSAGLAVDHGSDLGKELIMADASAQQPSAPPPTSVGQVMRPALTTVEQDAHVAAAAYLMKRAGATAVVIIDNAQTKRPLGIITEADIVRVVADGKDVNDVRVRDLMTSSPIVCQATTNIRDAGESMLAGQFRHLPVVDEAGLVGIVDIGDVSRALLSPPGP
jgi:CBS domain-containing protein